MHSEGKFPKSWPRARIPTPQRYLEALILLWVRFKDTPKELFWFFKLYDMVLGFCEDYHGVHTLNRMEAPFRGIMQSILDHSTDEDDALAHRNWNAGFELRDILIQSEKLLGARAAGPLRHDPYDYKYDDVRRAESSKRRRFSK